MSDTDLQLLARYTSQRAEDAFAEIVRRHLDLVFSAALRQVRSPQLAEEVAQSVFTDLARNAHRLAPCDRPATGKDGAGANYHTGRAPDTILTAWLYQVTRRTAIDVVRRESRRQLREQIATEMNAMNERAHFAKCALEPDWTEIEPLLDEAMQALDDTDRAAVLLRYFENKSLREVGQALGTSDDAAHKRVSRAVERLREFFAKRGVTVGASGLAVVLSANAVQAAPAGLAATISAAAAIAGTAISTSTAVTFTKTIAMTTIQKTIIIAVVAGAVVVGFYQARQASNLRSQVQTLKRQQEQQAALSNQVQALQQERDRATNALASISDENAALKKHPTEVLKLRGEVGRLRRESAEIGSSSALSKVTANPEARKMLRDQQKAGMTAIYKGFAEQMKLKPEQTDKLNDLLANHIMDNVDPVTTVLRDKPTADQMNQLFAAQDAALQEQVLALLGQEGLAQYQDYTGNLLSTLTAQQFKGMLTGDGAAKEEKSKQFRQAIEEETRAALAAAGLPADYQAVPILNFRNIASEQSGEQSLKLLDDIYQRVAARGSSFLSAEELAKFQEFRTTAINNSRTALTLNRTMMAPISK